MHCQYCGAEILQDSKFCTCCGAKVERRQKCCAGCGAELPEDSKFCSRCGMPAAAPVRQQNVQPPKKPQQNKVLQIVLTAALAVVAIVGIVLLVLTLGMGSEEAKWQEQYDLGVRYLSEGNYEEAILAFSAAIEIDPKRPEPYIWRGDAYAAIGDSEKAREDYEKALGLQPGNETVLEKISKLDLQQDVPVVDEPVADAPVEETTAVRPILITEADLIGDWRYFVPMQTGRPEIFQHEISLREDKTACVALSVAYSEGISVYTGTWAIAGQVDGDVLIEFNLTGGYFDAELNVPDTPAWTVLQTSIQTDKMQVQLYAGDELYVAYDGIYERGLDVETWRNREPESKSSTEYEVVLNQYRKALKNNFSNPGEYIAEIFQLYAPYPGTEFYYALRDINQDGTTELFIGGISGGNAMEIYDAFTLDGQTPIRFVSDTLGERSHMGLYTSGEYVIYGSSGAASFGWDYFVLPQGELKGRRLEGKEPEGSKVNEEDMGWTLIE